MKRSAPRRRSAFKFRAKLPAIVDRDTRMEQRAARMANLAEIHRAAPPVARGVIERVVGMHPVPKQPADRNQALRGLAAGEECQVRYRAVCRGPGVTQYTVWAHPNTQAENKGAGYKGNDSGGVFACDRCHHAIDFDRKLLPAIELEEVWRGARERTLIRLRFIARSITERPWRVRAAQWALERRGEQK